MREPPDPNTTVWHKQKKGKEKTHSLLISFLPLSREPKVKTENLENESRNKVQKRNNTPNKKFVHFFPLPSLPSQKKKPTKQHSPTQFYFLSSIFSATKQNTKLFGHRASAGKKSLHIPRQHNRSKQQQRHFLSFSLPHFFGHQTEPQAIPPPITSRKNKMKRKQNAAASTHNPNKPLD